jgi:hypothetical protein
LFRGLHFTLLATGAAPPPTLDPRFRDAVRALRVVRPGEAAGEGALVDADGAAHRIYGDGLILVRPDGYLGYTAAGGASQNLARYLGRFFG